MNYYIARVVEAGFDETVARIVAALKLEGFGVLTDIDVAATMKQKLGVEFRSYRILGACNPPLAHKALSAEDKIGVMLPCNVIVQDAGAGKTEVAAIDPRAAMERIGNPALSELAGEVAQRLARVLQTL
ncbi:MAG: DUF302 domain-containing protein [Roseiarcus sp.]|jgi:uncharacterized protein (DUF302 family)